MEREVRIEDVRGRESEFTLDRSGFALVKAPTGVADFYDPEEIKRVYYPEVEQLLRGTLGASRVFIFDHNVRNAARAGLAPPSRQVHNDHTVNSAPRRVRDHLGAEADELLKHGSVSSFADAPWFTQALGDYLQSKPVGLSKRDFAPGIRPATIEEMSVYRDFAREFADMTDCLLFAPVS